MNMVRNNDVPEARSLKLSLWECSAVHGRVLPWIPLPPRAVKYGLAVEPDWTGAGRENTIFGFSVTRQTALPIRIVPRFCTGGWGRFEKLLYGCRNT